jgi:hypothetical protein
MESNACYRAVYERAVKTMGRIVEKMPEYKELMRDPEVKGLMNSAVEQHSKYHAKRICGLKRHPLGKTPSRRRKARK